MKSLMNTEAGKWTPFLALIVCAGGFLAQTDEDVRLSGPHAQTPIPSPVAGEPLTGGQAGSPRLEVKPIRTSRYRAARAALSPPTNERPELTAWNGGRVRDPRHDPVPVEMVIVLEDEGDIADWQEQILRGTLRPHPEADIAKDRFRVPVRGDAVSHLGIRAGGRWWLIESVQPGCDGLVIEVPLESKTPAPTPTIGIGNSESSPIDSLHMNSDVERENRAYGVPAANSAPAMITRLGDGNAIKIRMTFANEITNTIGSSNRRVLTNSWISAIDLQNIEGLGSVVEENEAAESAHIDARPPTCLRMRAFDEGTGEEFYAWDLSPR